MTRMRRVDRGADRFIADARKDARRHFQHGRPDAKRCRRRRNLETNQPAADDEQMTAAAKSIAERKRVRFRAEVVDVRHSDWQVRNFTRRRTGGEDKSVVRQTTAVRKYDSAGGAI